MRDPRVVAAGSDGVVHAVFDGTTARMNQATQERFKAACDDAIPQEMTCGETLRIDQQALTGLLEKSEGIAVGTPKDGLPVIAEVVAEREVETGAVVAVGESVVEGVGGDDQVVSEAVTRPSRARDVLIGGFLSLLVMAAWYCATQL
jgi:hypothetical protein